MIAVFPSLSQFNDSCLAATNGPMLSLAMKHSLWAGGIVESRGTYACREESLLEKIHIPRLAATQAVDALNARVLSVVIAPNTVYRKQCSSR